MLDSDEKSIRPEKNLQLLSKRPAYPPRLNQSPDLKARWNILTINSTCILTFMPILESTAWIRQQWDSLKYHNSSHWILASSSPTTVRKSHGSRCWNSKDRWLTFLNAWTHSQFFMMHDHRPVICWIRNKPLHCPNEIRHSLII